MHAHEQLTYLGHGFGLSEPKGMTKCVGNPHLEENDLDSRSGRVYANYVYCTLGLRHVKIFPTKQINAN